MNLKFTFVYRKVDMFWRGFSLQFISGLSADIIVSNSLLLLIKLSAFVYITDKLRKLALEIFRVDLL